MSLHDCPDCLCEELSWDEQELDRQLSFPEPWEVRRPCTFEEQCNRAILLSTGWEDLVHAPLLSARDNIFRPSRLHYELNNDPEGYQAAMHEYWQRIWARLPLFGGLQEKLVEAQYEELAEPRTSLHRFKEYALDFVLGRSATKKPQ